MRGPRPAVLERLTVPVQWKSDSAGDRNVLTGYASTFGNVDLGGDVVLPGAFAKTIANVKANGIPLLADHVASTGNVIGTIFDAKEDATGLLIRARLSTAPSAQDVAVKLREGHVNKLSIGYEVMDESYEDRNGQKVRLLKEVRLWETSAVVFPMNPEAAVTSAKRADDDLLTLKLRLAQLEVAVTLAENRWSYGTSRRSAQESG